MLVKAKDKLPLTGKAFRLAFGQSSLFVPSFEKVQKRRESLATHLNGNLLERANAISSKVVDCVMGRIDSLKGRGILDCRSVSQHMAFSILGATLFGDSFLQWSSATVYEELLMMIAKDACLWASYNVLPFWRRGYWKYRVLCARLKRLTQDIVRMCRQNYDSTSEVTSSLNKYTEIGRKVGIDPTFSPNDVITGGLFLEDFNGHLNPVEEPCGNIMGVMFHGCLTTAGLIGSILTWLVMHPKIQEKIYSEIVMVRKESAKVEANDVEKMHFLLATVYESARLLPAGPLLQRCSLKHDLNLEGGITVPAGAIMVVPVQVVQMDDSSWGSDANEFNPYRFLSRATQQGEADSGNNSFLLDDPNQNAAFLPFGYGTRACVGQKFAIFGITTLIASLLERYEVKLKPGDGKDPRPMMYDSVLQLLPSPKIVFIKRET